MVDIEKFSMIGRLGYPLYHKLEAEGFPDEGAGPQLAPAQHDNWMVQALGATEKTNEPIRDYQRLNVVTMPDNLKSDYEYKPSEAYFQTEANILGSIPTIGRLENLESMTDTQIGVFMNQDYWKTSTEIIPLSGQRQWWGHSKQFKEGQLFKVLGNHHRPTRPHDVVWKVVTEHESNWYFDETQQANCELIGIDIKDYIPNESVTVGHGRYAKSPADGIVYLYRSKEERTTSAAFDTAEETRWDKIAPKLSLSLMFSHTALTSGAYLNHIPVETRENDILLANNSDFIDHCLLFFRALSDYFNISRLTLLSDNYIDTLYTHHSGRPVYSTHEQKVRWAEGVGLRIFPKLQILLALRNANMRCYYMDAYSNAAWFASGASAFYSQPDFYDVYGLSRNGQTQDEIADKEYATKRQSLTVGCAAGSVFMSKAVYNWKRPRELDSTTKKLFLDPEWIAVVNEVASNNFEPNDRLIAGAESKDRIDKNKVYEEIEDYGRFWLGVAVHEFHGHGYFGCGHPTLTGDTLAAHNHLKNSGQHSEGLRDLPYFLGDTISETTRDHLSVNFPIRFWHWMQKDPENRDFYGAQFTREFGYNIHYQDSLTQ